MKNLDLLDPKTFEQNPLFIRPNETSEQYTARVNSPKAPSTPAPIKRDYAGIASNAGKAGLGVSDYSSLLGATPEEQKAAKDDIASQFGYENSDKLMEEIFAKPSKTTEQFYNQAYSTAGLDKLLTSITAKRTSLNKAVGAINDNPWLTEASRTGKARNLQQLATADISAYEQEYNLKHDRVKELIARHMADIGQDEKVRDARFKYLENSAKTKAEAAATARASEYLSDYLSGKQSATKPQTVSVPGTNNVYEFDPVTSDWKQIQKAVPKPVAAKKASSPVTSAEEKTITAFNTAVASRTEINKAGTREQFIRQLQAKFPTIDPNDIARKVYETYPDGFDAK